MLPISAVEVCVVVWEDVAVVDGDVVTDVVPVVVGVDVAVVNADDVAVVVEVVLGLSLQSMSALWSVSTCLRL